MIKIAHTYVETNGIHISLLGDLTGVTKIEVRGTPKTNEISNIIVDTRWFEPQITLHTQENIVFIALIVSNVIDVRLYKGETLYQEITLSVMEESEFVEVVDDTVDTNNDELKIFYVSVVSTTTDSSLFYVVVWRDIYDVAKDQGVQMPLKARLVDSITGEVSGFMTGRVERIQTSTSGFPNASNGLQIYTHLFGSKGFIDGRKYLFIYEVAGETQVDSLIWNSSRKFFEDTLPVSQQWRRASRLITRSD